jgi:TolA-binding protein
MAKATASKTKGKLTKKELKQDKLVEFTFKAETFYHNNKNLVIGSAVALAVVILAVVVWNSSRKSSILEESYQLTMAKMNYGSGKLDEAKQGFQLITSQMGGKPAGEAKYFLGRIAFEQGDFSSAENEFSDYLKEYSVDNAMDASALAGLAATYEAQGRLDQAMDNYEKIAEKYPKLAFAPQALQDVARLAQKLNQPEQAKKALQRILDDYPESMSAQQARKDLEPLK